MQTTHRIWDFRGDQVAIVWFRKESDGSFQMVGGYLNGGLPLAHYAAVARSRGIEPDSIDYVRDETRCKGLWSGVTLFDALKTFHLHPEILPAAAWQTRHPFSEAA